jgi:hypothetical protein
VLASSSSPSIHPSARHSSPPPPPTSPPPSCRPSLVAAAAAQASAAAFPAIGFKQLSSHSSHGKDVQWCTLPLSALFISSRTRVSNAVLTLLQARRYDSRTTTFSPEGRLYQVEYAIEAIGHAGICIGILATDGVLLGVEKKISSKLLEITTSEKMYKVTVVAASAATDLLCATILRPLSASSNNSPRAPDWRPRWMRDGGHHRRRQHPNRQGSPRRAAL